jgi:peroxiredoxin
MLETGRRAPDFELPSLDGKPLKLPDILAKGPALLAFFKVTCPVCQFTFPFLERIFENAGGLQVYGISQDNARDTREFNEEFGLTFPTLLDDERKGYPVSNAFGIYAVPSVFLVEQDGTISSAASGFSKAELEQLGRRAGVAPFRPGEFVPEWKAG